MITRSDVTEIRKLAGWTGDARLLECQGEYYIASATVVPYSGPEVLVFPANSNGEVTDWSEIVGGRGTLNHEEFIVELVDWINDNRNYIDAEVLAIECGDDSDDEDGPEALSEYEADDRFQDFLNEIHEMVKIGDYNYDPARVLKEVDPIAYREEFLNWLDSEERDGRYTFPWNV